MKKILILFLFLYSGNAFTQSLPDEMYLSPDGRTLYTGREDNAGFFDQTYVRSFYLTFPQPNYWSLLTSNYSSHTDLPATLMVDGVTYDSVGVRFKGQTSYSGTGSSQKKSFNLNFDSFIKGQDIYGYDILNLNNGFQDASFMREVFFQHQIHKHIPAAKSSFAKLYINGENWGVYPCIQQLDGDFYKEWFMSNDGTNWRADKPPGSPGGPGGGWGDGTAALNYLGADTSLYQPYYTLKKSHKAEPWNDLVKTCHVLDTVSLSNLESVLADYLDLDRTLWHLASEILFSDDDSYIYKGKMDYYVYYEAETGRITPIEYDGNSVMSNSAVNWSPFYNANKVNYPLLYRLLAVPELRQRYLAHMRTLIEEALDTSSAFQIMDQYRSLIDTMVQNDPKKFYSHAQFVSEIQTLKNWIVNRKANLLANAEVNVSGPEISNVSYFSQGVQWQQPVVSEPVLVQASVNFLSGLDHVNLYYATGIVGNFEKTIMYDDGAHNDSAAGDGIYAGEIPALPGGTWVRYYIEAVANNSASTVSYLPVGAEHDVFVYLILPGMASDTSVVINEVMASNLTTAADSSGEFDDWIELYNKSSLAVDISDFYLTDNDFNYIKWQFPVGTVIQPNDYLIVWADENGSQAGLHCNFKLSSSGERVILLNPNREIVDQVSFGAQVTDQGLARVPNGTGNFIIQMPTFGFNNNLSTDLETISSLVESISVSPNPAGNTVKVYSSLSGSQLLELFDRTGRLIYSQHFNGNHIINTSDFSNGLYFVRCGAASARLIIHH
ncbi:MAG TPA: CotH kinase family protein [Bacteroidia bacterium]|nr:CotH kinase family protein [Bacteroidia bacterium]